MSKIESQMNTANIILKKLETFDPTCILAGGAPRDWFLGKPATDLDFYVHFRNELPIRYIEGLLHDLGLDAKIKELSNPEIPMNYRHNPYLKRVFEIESYEGIKVQIMQMEIPTFRCVVDLFPLDICKIWYKNGRITPHPDFENCIRTNTIHVVNLLYSKRDKYLEKIKNKFPEFKWKAG